MSQLQFLETVAKDNLENVNKHLLRSLRSNHKAGATDAREPYVFALQQETIHFAAKQTAQTVNRVFVAGEDYPQYKTVGWLLYTDVSPVFHRQLFVCCILTLLYLAKNE